MGGGIYLVQGDDLVPMTEQPYDSEEILQQLLARHPQLLAGDQDDQAGPRRWQLVAREMPVPGVLDGAGRWSLDHLFVDHEGVPTLVEVKRSTDTRIRREVVGQMLDYAANAVLYWPVETIRSRFEATCEANARDPDEALVELLGPDADAEAFWQSVKINLQAGRIRLVFLADVIPPALQRIVEFLNGQMDPAEVLAVEIRQYVGQGQRAVSPRILGQTAESRGRKSTPRPTGRQWDEKSFFQALEAASGPNQAAAARRILRWTQDKGLAVRWGKGKVAGTLRPTFEHLGKQYSPIAIYTDAKVEVVFGAMKTLPSFEAEERRRELWARLNQIEGVSLPPENLNGWPSFPLATLITDAAIQSFLGTLDWFFQQAAASQSKNALALPDA